MKALLLPLIYFTKDLFVDNTKSSLKEVLIHKLAKDTKSLIILMIISNIVCLMVAATLTLGSYVLMDQFTNLTTSELLMYTSVIMASLSLLGCVYIYNSVSKKVKTYKTIARIIESPKKDLKAVMNPFVTQFFIEHNRMSDSIRKRIQETKTPPLPKDERYLGNAAAEMQRRGMDQSYYH